MYDTPDAVTVSGSTVTESGNRLSYTLLTDKKYTGSGVSGHDIALSSTTTLSYYRDNLVSADDPIMILSDIDASVKSVYIVWYGAEVAFDFKFELRDSSENLISEYEDRTKTALTENSPVNTLQNQIVSAHGKWNIPDISNVEVPGVYQPGPTNKAIQTNNGAAFDASFTDVTISPYKSLTWMMRFKYKDMGGTSSPYFILKMQGNVRIGMNDHAGTSGLAATSSGADSNPFTTVDDTWYTVVCRVVEGERMFTYSNNVDYTGTATTQSSASNGIYINSLQINPDLKYLAEIDYLVVVPDSLTEAQMTSLYSDYSEGQDIAGFLSANGLSPTVNYQFNGDNTNSGSTGAALPAITFQATDVYTDYTTQTLVQASKN
eukprot:442942-Pyramimonas_sp.AAC.1